MRNAIGEMQTEVQREVDIELAAMRAEEVNLARRPQSRAKWWVERPENTSAAQQTPESEGCLPEWPRLYRVVNNRSDRSRRSDR